MSVSIPRRGLIVGGTTGVVGALVTAGTAHAATPESALERAINAGPARAASSKAGIGTMAVATGVQFTGTLAARASARWFTFNWPATWQVVWTAMSNSPHAGVIQIDWSVAVERASFDFVTYHITIRNLSSEHVDVEGRYGVLNL
jgi:hypothetical protein